MGETVESAFLAVAGGRGEDQSEIGRVPLFKKAPLESDDQFVGRTDANKARHANCVAIANNRDGFIGGDDLVLEGHPAYCLSESHLAIPEPRKACDLPPTNTPTWPPGSGSSV